jgi:hypothetical protein
MQIFLCCPYQGGATRHNSCFYPPFSGQSRFLRKRRPKSIAWTPRIVHLIASNTPFDVNRRTDSRLPSFLSTDVQAAPLILKRALATFSCISLCFAICYGYHLNRSEGLAQFAYTLRPAGIPSKTRAVRLTVAYGVKSRMLNETGLDAARYLGFKDEQMSNFAAPFSDFDMSGCAANFITLLAPLTLSGERV